MLMSVANEIRGISRIEINEYYFYKIQSYSSKSYSK